MAQYIVDAIYERMLDIEAWKRTSDKDAFPEKVKDSVSGITLSVCSTFDQPTKVFYKFTTQRDLCMGVGESNDFGEALEHKERWLEELEKKNEVSDLCKQLGINYEEEV